jgi:hypothetical protein
MAFPSQYLENRVRTSLLYSIKPRRSTGWKKATICSEAPTRNKINSRKFKKKIGPKPTPRFNIVEKPPTLENLRVGKHTEVS